MDTRIEQMTVRGSDDDSGKESERLHRTGHGGWTGEAGPGLLLMLRRRAVSSAAWTSCHITPTDDAVKATVVVEHDYCDPTAPIV